MGFESAAPSGGWDLKTEGHDVDGVLIFDVLHSIFPYFFKGRNRIA